MFYFGIKSKQIWFIRGPSRQYPKLFCTYMVCFQVHIGKSPIRKWHHHLLGFVWIYHRFVRDLKFSWICGDLHGFTWICHPIRTLLLVRFWLQARINYPAQNMYRFRTITNPIKCTYLAPMNRTSFTFLYHVREIESFWQPLKGCGA